MHVGIIGLGLMGRAIASRLYRGGYRVSGFDIDPAVAEQAQALNVHVLKNSRAVARECDIVILSLPDSDARRDLLHGEPEFADALRSGAVVLDTTTGRPEDLEADYARLANDNVRLVDVCLIGSSEDVASGDVVAVVGDSPKHASYEPVIVAIARQVFYVGEPGQANRVKLIVNLVLGLNRLAFAEGMGLANKAGIDLSLMVDILRSGAAYSRAMDAKGERITSGDFTPAARLRQHAKDVRLILAMANKLNARVPASELHSGMLQEALDHGWGDLDNSAIYKLYE